MIRFIILRSHRDNISGMDAQEFETIDADVPELEAALLSGGYGENGYDRRECIGVSVIRPNNLYRERDDGKGNASSD